jgi:hypothetical protein
MATLLATYSPSKGGSDHQVLLGGDGNTYCSCPAWKYQKLPPKARTCKHRDDYLAGAFGAAQVIVAPAASIGKPAPAVVFKAKPVAAPAPAAVPTMVATAKPVADKRSARAARATRIAEISAQMAALSAELSMLMAQAMAEAAAPAETLAAQAA